MRAQPFTFYKAAQEKLPEYECSDRIVLPSSYCTEMSITNSDLLMLADTCKKTVCGTVFGRHTDNPTIIYIPTWMCLLLDVPDSVSVASMSKKRCVNVRIKPHSAIFYTNPIFLPMLQNALKEHHSITVGCKIPLLVTDTVTTTIEYATIEEIQPLDAPTCILQDTVDVQFVDPREADHALSFLYKTGRHAENHPFVFVGRGRMLGGKMFPRSPPQQAAAEAAKRRLALAVEGKKTY